MSNVAPSVVGDAGSVIAGNLDAHWWFTMLDQRLVWVSAEPWMTQVVGIHVDGFDLWIQMEAAARQIRTFIVRVTTGRSLEEVIAEIEGRIATS